MTWAPCPHGVRTRGKKGAAPRIPHKGHDDSAHKGEGINIFFLCCLRFPLPLLVLFCALVSVLIIKGTAPCDESEETILPESEACIKGELFVSEEGACWMPTLHKSENVGQGSSKTSLVRRRSPTKAWLISSGMSAKEKPRSACSVTLLQKHQMLPTNDLFVCLPVQILPDRL